MYKQQYHGGINGVGAGLNDQKPSTTSQYQREGTSGVFGGQGTNQSSIEKSPDRLRRSMTPNFDLNQNKPAGQGGENSVNYSRVSYKPSFDGSRLDMNQPPAKGMMESVSASGLKGKTYESGSKADLNEAGKYHTSQGFWPNYGKLGTESSAQQNQNFTADYR